MEPSCNASRRRARRFTTGELPTANDRDSVGCSVRVRYDPRYGSRRGSRKRLPRVL